VVVPPAAAVAVMQDAVMQDAVMQDAVVPVVGAQEKAVAVVPVVGAQEKAVVVVPVVGAQEKAVVEGQDWPAAVVAVTSSARARRRLLGSRITARAFRASPKPLPRVAVAERADAAVLAWVVRATVADAVARVTVARVTVAAITTDITEDIAAGITTGGRTFSLGCTGATPTRTTTATGVAVTTLTST
jgi:hypothetical protein